MTLCRRVLMSAEWISLWAVCARMCLWGLEKPWELHLLCKCKPLIDCRARSLSFSGWTLPSAGSRGSCQGNVCPHTHIHTRSRQPLFLCFPLLEHAWHEAKVKMGRPLTVPCLGWALAMQNIYVKHWYDVLFDQMHLLKKSILRSLILYCSVHLLFCETIDLWGAFNVWQVFALHRTGVTRQWGTPPGFKLKPTSACFRFYSWIFVGRSVMDWSQ